MLVPLGCLTELSASAALIQRSKTPSLIGRARRVFSVN
jgi:hypothetical protein